MPGRRGFPFYFTLSYLSCSIHVMVRLLATGIGLGLSLVAMSQSIIHKPDTVQVLQEIVVKGYSYDRPLSEVPAAIGYVDTKSLERFSNTSLLPAVNTIPGVRMEERSPGSYRFAIRGSSLRSPFGVREVKMYWNGLPLTDGGGNTYLNLLDFNAIGTAEIIKGPGASLYGAGSGGVMLLTSPTIKEAQAQFSASGGSYGLLRYQIATQEMTNRVKVNVQYGHQQADGYRYNTRMRRDALNANLEFGLTPVQKLSATLFYTDLSYQTPGGLTQAQYNADPRQARANAATLQAGVYNKTFYSGLMHEYRWNSHWSNRTGIYGSYTDFQNPTFLNYEIRKESNVGGRSETQYKVERDRWKGKLTMGGEFQSFWSPVTDYGNTKGKPDTVQVADKLESALALLFVQAELELPASLYLTLGGSATFLHYRFTRLSDAPPSHETRNFNPVFSPRIALLKKLTSQISGYVSVSQGFSAPSLAEVRPSTNTYNNALTPERGTNYEAGFRGNLLDQKVSFDMAVYSFQLNNTIVIQPSGDYINSGRTSQPGVEWYMMWTVISDPNKFFSSLRTWVSYTYNPYRFKNYRVNGVDNSGHRLTGVARDIEVAGVDLISRPGVYVNFTFNHVGDIPVNDANTAFAAGYYLFGARCGYKTGIVKELPLEFFAGVDNALNRRYSLGNDLNAAAGRYFNAAALRNFYVGLKGRF
jgi:iron complex outermembrane receptor protein